MLVNCNGCGSEFNKKPSEVKRSKNHYCSRSCSNKVNNSKKPKRKGKSLICQKCSVVYVRQWKNGHSSKIHCFECSKSLRSAITEQTQRMTLRDCRERQSVKGKHKSWLHVHVRNNCRSWNKDLVGSPCQMCGYTLHTELCHIKDIASFDDNATLGEINDPSNILVLCRNHHWEFDNGHLKLEDVPPRP